MVNEDATPVLHPKTGQRPRAHMDALELGIHHFGLLIRDDDIVKMRLNGVKDFVQGGLIKLFEQLKKHGELRIHSVFCPKLSL